MMGKLRIAHLAGPTATIQNTPPLVTSNKARVRNGLPPMTDAAGEPLVDALRAQRLAAPVKIYVEQFSAHPLEADSEHLYGPPDGFLDRDGNFTTERRSPEDWPVYEIELKPEDGLYPLPYMAVQGNGSAWEEEAVAPGAAEARQGFFPDGSRSFEEIDRLSMGMDGRAGLIGSRAEVDFFRIAPPGGYRKGLEEAGRSDQGSGAISPERMGDQFFAYKPFHLAKAPPRPMLAKITNEVQAILASGDYDGAIWTQGSPQIEEIAYWFNLLIDSDVPIACNAAQRPQGQISNDGPANIVDSVTYIGSRIWADDGGRNRVGTVVIQEQQFFAAREVAKVDARPGGYVATGGHGGILGQVTHTGKPYLMYVPAYRHTARSVVNITNLPSQVTVAVMENGTIRTTYLTIKDDRGKLLPEAIPSVSIVKDGGFAAEDFGEDRGLEADLDFLIRHKMGSGRLAGFVVEGLVPYGMATSELRMGMLRQAVFCGAPLVRVGRGSPEGFADPDVFTVAGMNLTATKARLLLMACLMKLGSLPVAEDPANPTDAEREATRTAIARYQEIFDTH
jgi:L-asparaginase